ncbi:MAG: PQQ-binding-like beta-propeller repeat protein [Mycobacteriales bacterium]
MRRFALALAVALGALALPHAVAAPAPHVAAHVTRHGGLTPHPTREHVRDTTSLRAVLAEREKRGSAALTIKVTSPTVGAGTTPDVTGDGRADVLEIHYLKRVFVLRDGHTGRALWTVDARSQYLVAYATLGRPARPSLLTASFTTDAAGELRSTGVTALDLRTGQRLWAHQIASTSRGAGPVTARKDVLVPLDVIPRRGRADLVVALTTTNANAGYQVWASLETPTVLDGTAGATFSTGTPIPSEYFSDLTVLGDLDGDRIPDLGFATIGNAVQLYGVESSVTGKMLWAGAKPHSTFGAALLPLGDVTHDGIPDVLLDQFGFAGDGAVSALSGTDGAEVWALAADDGVPAGDMNHDGALDILTSGFDVDGVRFRGVSGRTGRVLWTRRIAPPASARSYGIGYGPAGDADDDGVVDGYVDLQVGNGPHQDTVVLAGRGTAVRLPLSGAFPLGLDLDGHGDDFLLATPARHGLSVTATALRRRVFTRSLVLGRSADLLFADAGHLGFSSQQDLLLSTYDDKGGNVLAVDGRTGVIRWKARVNR